MDELVLSLDDVAGDALTSTTWRDRAGQDKGVRVFLSHHQYPSYHIHMNSEADKAT